MRATPGAESAILWVAGPDCAIIAVMGRHARGLVRSRLTATTVGIVVPVVLLVAAGSWWAVGATSDVGSTVTRSAVVVSSLACQNGDEGTVVDILSPAGQPADVTRRATIDSCGHRQGEVLAVAYSTDDPTRVVPAALDQDDDTARVMPLAVVLVVLLGLVAVVALIRDQRRARAAAADPPHGRHSRPEPDEPPVAEVEPLPHLAPPSDLDLLFPDHARLAVNLHDELFTHRSPAGV